MQLEKPDPFFFLPISQEINSIKMNVKTHIFESAFSHVQNIQRQRNKKFRAVPNISSIGEEPPTANYTGQ